ncbi:MAG: radical SAM protein [Bacteroidales bacterium]|nr:radical SAM protein [Bacteroidales bacterium]
MKEKLLGMTLGELKSAAQACGLKPFVGAQLADWLYAKRVGSWDRMANISKAARQALAQRYDLGVSAPVGTAVSSDGTKKYLFKVSARTPDRTGAHPDIPDAGVDGERFVESVMIPDDDRFTLCVSSQAGCRMGCKFCMTGRNGFHGQLDAADILNQFLSIDEAASLTNTVFMGMGEPLDNYDAVARVIEVLTAPWGFAWSPKRITVSTIGVLPTLKKFLDGQRCHLAVSLHNPFPEERLEMMPVQKAWDIRDVIGLIREYDFSGQRRVSFEYTMFAGFNDDKRHADALIRLLRGLECRVNLIRFHKIPDFPYDCASDQAMAAFRDRLNNHQILCTIRASRGEDILAACGMLAGQHAD